MVEIFIRISSKFQTQDFFVPKVYAELAELFHNREHVATRWTSVPTCNHMIGCFQGWRGCNTIGAPSNFRSMSINPPWWRHKHIGKRLSPSPLSMHTFIFVHHRSFFALYNFLFLLCFGKSRWLMIQFHFAGRTYQTWLLISPEISFNFPKQTDKEDSTLAVIKRKPTQR